ncbi:MAG: hypothetical protein QUV08_12405 [Parasphingorhabdus sp.]|jgi:hypothetical protein|nr:hypothetical protein [Parasphingorhabdus sp.]|tara:strand:+ start:29828 stop:30193 length:366 start_codon:yes stop_codon:yes gene_type:complete
MIQQRDIDNGVKAQIGRDIHALAHSPGMAACTERRARQIILYGHDAASDLVETPARLLRRAQSELIHAQEDIGRGTAMLRHAQKKAAEAMAYACAAYDALELDIAQREAGAIQEELFQRED